MGGRFFFFKQKTAYEISAWWSSECALPIWIEIAGIEYIADKKGKIYTYDVNTNTNYNSQAEKNSEIKGMRSIAKFLKEELLLLSNIKVVA